MIYKISLKLFLSHNANINLLVKAFITLLSQNEMAKSMSYINSTECVGDLG